MRRRPRVVITDYIEPDLDYETAEMGKRGVELELHQLKLAREEEVAEVVRGADVVVVNMVHVTPAVASALAGCSVVIRHGAGYDNVDVDALTAAGVPFTYAPDYCSDEVAEHAVALMFACMRRICSSRPFLDRSIEERKWDYAGLGPIRRLSTRALGIVGCGRIGGRVLAMARGLGFARILVCDPYLTRSRLEELDITPVGRELLLRESDVVTLHCPLTTETRSMIDRDSLAEMKPTAVLINTARGPLVDHAAVAASLESGRLGAVGMDVFDLEPPERGYPLRDLPEAVLTPHLAWYSNESAWGIRYRIVEEIDRALAGEPPLFCVNPVTLEGRGSPTEEESNIER